MSATPQMLDIALKLKPDMVTLVPERTTELTTERGFSLASESLNVKGFIERFHKDEIAVCLFIDPTDENIKLADDIKTDYVELNTSYYSDAKDYKTEKDEFKKLERAANHAKDKGIDVNAGHGLNYVNIKSLLEVKAITEYSIGHSIVAKSIFTGLMLLSGNVKFGYTQSKGKK
jgi:pyridoxine 5-phosphate synthase